MQTENAKLRQTIYETITATLLAAVESNPGDPIMPWQRGGTRPVLPTNAVTGQAYRGVNILSLWVTALQRGYGSGGFATLRQWNEKGAKVRKGEKASPIVFYKLCGWPHNLYYVALADMWRRLRQLRCGALSRAPFATYSSAGDCSPPTRAEINHALRTLQVSGCHRSLSHRPLCQGS